MQIQTGIMAQKQAEKVGQTVRVLCDGIDEESGLYLCRTTGDAPEVDGNVCVSSEEPLYPGQFYDVLVEDSGHPVPQPSSQTVGTGRSLCCSDHADAHGKDGEQIKMSKSVSKIARIVKNLLCCVKWVKWVKWGNAAGSCLRVRNITSVIERRSL